MKTVTLSYLTKAVIVVVTLASIFGYTQTGFASSSARDTSGAVSAQTLCDAMWHPHKAHYDSKGRCVKPHASLGTIDKITK